MSSTSFLGLNNTNIMYMQYNDGFIGVGCYNPAVKMDVAGGFNVRSNVSFQAESVHIQQASFSNTIVLGSNNGQVVLSSSNNNLGVSTASPTEKLDVTGKVQTSSQFLATSNDTSNVPGYSFTGNSNTGMFHAAHNVLGFSTAGVERLRLEENGNIGIATSTPTEALDVNGNAIIRSNVTIMGRLTVSNVTYITSNVFIYSSETIQSNLHVGDASTHQGPASFSNIISLGSNNGVVTFTASNGMLGINLDENVMPRANLDISNGNILARNYQKLAKTSDNSNPISITLNWDKAFTSNNLYHIVLDAYQSITNGDAAGFKSQRIAIGLSNSDISWIANQNSFGDATAYQTMMLTVATKTNKSVTLQSATTWTEPGEYAHGFNINVVNFPLSSRVGNIFLT